MASNKSCKYETARMPAAQPYGVLVGVRERTNVERETALADEETETNLKSYLKLINCNNHATARSSACITTVELFGSTTLLQKAHSVRLFSCSTTRSMCLRLFDGSVIILCAWAAGVGLGHGTSSCSHLPSHHSELAGSCRCARLLSIMASSFALSASLLLCQLATLTGSRWLRRRGEHARAHGARARKHKTHTQYAHVSVKGSGTVATRARTKAGRQEKSGDWGDKSGAFSHQFMHGGMILGADSCVIAPSCAEAERSIRRMQKNSPPTRRSLTTRLRNPRAASPKVSSGSNVSYQSTSANPSRARTVGSASISLSSSRQPPGPPAQVHVAASTLAQTPPAAAVVVAASKASNVVGT